VVHRLRPEPGGLAEEPGRLADEVDELLDRHGVAGDLAGGTAVAVGGHRHGDDPGDVGTQTVRPPAQSHRFDEGFVSLGVEPGSEAARPARPARRVRYVRHEVQPPGA